MKALVLLGVALVVAVDRPAPQQVQPSTNATVKAPEETEATAEGAAPQPPLETSNSSSAPALPEPTVSSSSSSFPVLVNPNTNSPSSSDPATPSGSQGASGPVATRTVVKTSNKSDFDLPNTNSKTESAPSTDPIKQLPIRATNESPALINDDSFQNLGDNAPPAFTPNGNSLDNNLPGLQADSVFSVMNSPLPNLGDRLPSAVNISRDVRLSSDPLSSDFTYPNLGDVLPSFRNLLKVPVVNTFVVPAVTSDTSTFPNLDLGSPSARTTDIDVSSSSNPLSSSFRFPNLGDVRATPGILSRMLSTYTTSGYWHRLNNNPLTSQSLPDLETTVPSSLYIDKNVNSLPFPMSPLTTSPTKLTGSPPGVILSLTDDLPNLYLGSVDNKPAGNLDSSLPNVSAGKSSSSPDFQDLPDLNTKISSRHTGRAFSKRQTN